MKPRIRDLLCLARVKEAKGRELFMARRRYESFYFYRRAARLYARAFYRIRQHPEVEPMRAAIGLSAAFAWNFSHLPERAIPIIQSALTTASPENAPQEYPELMDLLRRCEEAAADPLRRWWR